MKRGFTLIELLAVIVVLAIVALIATPIVSGAIEKSKKKSAIESGNNLIKTVELYMVTSKKNYGKINLLSDDLKYNGKKPEFGEVEISKEGKTRIYAYTNGYCVTKEYYTDSVVANKMENKEECKGFSEYLCKSVISATAGNVPQGNFDYGDEYICNLGETEESKNLTFFVLDKDNDSVSLIMNMNLGGNVAWCGDRTLCLTNGSWDNTIGPITAQNTLETRTEDWVKLEKEEISLPTMDQIKATYYYNQGGNLTMPTWLYVNLNNNGYWTSTLSSYNTDGAMRLNYDAHTYNAGIETKNVAGIRPVITISKSQIG